MSVNNTDQEVNMARTKDKSLDPVIEKARKELMNYDDDRIAFKLAVISSYKNNTPEQVIENFQIKRRTFFDWVKSFREEGINGLKSKKKGHKPPILKSNHKQIIENWIETSKTPGGKPIHWTLEKLSHYIQLELGLTIKKSALSLALRSMGITLRRPRPSHSKANAEEQASFKKKLQKNS